MLVAALFILRWPEFDEWRDGFVYAAALGIGFDTVENLLHAPGLPLVEQVARSLTLPITHTLFSAVWGLGVARAIFGCEPVVKRVAWAVGSILLGMALHGFYDFLVFTPGNLAWSSGLVLGIWIVVLVRLRSRGGGLGPGSPR